MDTTDLAQVLRAGAAVAAYPTGQAVQLEAALRAMADEAKAISRRGLADPPAPGWHRYLQPPTAAEQPPHHRPPEPGPYWVIEVFYHGTTPVVAWWEGARWWLPGYGSDNYVTWWAPIPPPPFGEDEAHA